ncbi:MAG: YicC domain-containing protein [Gammaproteobacteria bacterium]|nr:MAG: YicC domain-containing protein [Gammaproteobacteria bacterium]TND02915.1 MAG: YicC domain-containing protein [Gammaproteobacteria bacterium]
MILSMTAFARQSRDQPWGQLSWELRTVNHRYLDVSLRVPDELRVQETQLRELVGAYVKRGKVDCRLRFQPAAGATAQIHLNRELIARLSEAIGAVTAQVPSTAPVSALEILRWPGVIEGSDTNLDEIQAEAVAILEDALKELVDTRAREGARLQEILEQRCATLAELVDEARTRLPDIKTAWRERLLARLAEVKADLDDARLAQEMVFFAQKIDIEEELERLATHIDEVRRVLRQDEPVGRRLDFLMQELNREANTLGSKSVDAQTTRISVDMKVQLEQMREQIQNIE